MSQISLLKSDWMNLKVFPLALKMVSLNSATAVPVHSVLNSSHGVIGPASIIEGITYRYILRRVMIKAGYFFLIPSRLCAISFPKDVPTCFVFAPIPKCDV